MNNSAIEWTDKASNPIVAINTATGKCGWFCTKKSRGCRDCYSEGMNLRFGNGLKYAAANESRVRFEIAQAELGRILRSRGTAKKDRVFDGPTRVFMCDMIDLWHPLIPDKMIDQVFAAMALKGKITFMILTKRPERMREYLSASQRDFRWRIGDAWDGEPFRSCPDTGPTALSGWPLPNIQLGVSVEDQATADARIPDLIALAGMGWTTYVSYEPAIGPVDFSPWMRTVDRRYHAAEGTAAVACGDAHVACTGLGCQTCKSARRIRAVGLDGVICGGETGPGAAPMHPDWARTVRDQCAAAGVPFFFKAWGEWGTWPPSIDCAYPTLWWRQDGREGAWWDDPSSTLRMARVGRQRSGRLLDGVEHNGLPGQPMNGGAS